MALRLASYRKSSEMWLHSGPLLRQSPGIWLEGRLGGTDLGTKSLNSDFGALGENEIAH